MNGLSTNDDSSTAPAAQPAADRLVALKLLHPGRLISQGEVARFQREAEV